MRKAQVLGSFAAVLMIGSTVWAGGKRPGSVCPGPHVIAVRVVNQTAQATNVRLSAGPGSNSGIISSAKSNLPVNLTATGSMLSVWLPNGATCSGVFDSAKSCDTAVNRGYTSTAASVLINLGANQKLSCQVVAGAVMPNSSSLGR